MNGFGWAAEEAEPTGSHPIGEIGVVRAKEQSMKKRRNRGSHRQSVVRALENYQRNHGRKDKWEPYRLRDAILRDMGFDSYQQYLQSDKWAAIRSRALLKNQGRCFKCGRQATQVHHSRYEHKGLSGQSLRHLWPVCAKCHTSAEVSESGEKRSIHSANCSLRTLTKGQIKYWRDVCQKCFRNKCRRNRTICVQCQRDGVHPKREP